MWLDRDVARSDVILAAASAAFGPSVVGFLLLFDIGPIATSIYLQVGLAITIGLVPWALARNRGDGWAAFGHRDDDPSTLLSGLLLGLPIVSMFLLLYLNAGGSIVDAGLGRLRLSGPVIGPIDIVDTVLRVAEGIVLGVSAWLLMTFLAVRGRDGFRANEVDITEGLRTFGLAAVGASFVLGLLRSFQSLGWVNVVGTPIAGLVIILLADRLIPPRISINRSMLLGPMIAWSVIVFLVSGGGFFSGNPLVPLHRAASSAMLVAVVSALVAAGRTRATILLIALATLYPTCMGPLHLEGLLGIGVPC